MRVPMAPDGAKGCSALARYRGEALAGSAGHNTGWLLIEHPGPWAKDAFASRGLDAEAVTDIKQQAAAAGVRPLLIKRSDRRAGDGPRLAFLVGSARPTPWIRRLEFDSLPDLAAGVDLNATRQSTPPSLGTAVEDPMYLVCTHAKRDACCAMYGRPIAEALGRDHSGVWESSHLGGDRFAPNLVALPHGFSFGHLDVASARQVVKGCDAGELVLDSYRGRCLDSFPAQTAEVYARRTYGIRDVNAIAPLGERPTDDGFAIDFGYREHTLTTTVIKTESVVCATACSSEESTSAIRYRAVEVDSSAPLDAVGT